jgi:CelD/BcsL family acetyltransferase involved in cellulose biosynthesis
LDHPASARIEERAQAPAWAAPPDERAYRVVVVQSAAGLADHAGAWNDLARASAAPNPFHESWFLLPALDAFAGSSHLLFLLVYADVESAPPELCGFFPFERVARYRGLPLPHLRLWRPVHAYLGTPLVRRGCVHGVLAAAHDWLATDRRGCAVVEWGWIATDGDFLPALHRLQERRGLRALDMLTESRALLRRSGDGARYLAEAISPKSRKELRRLERRLAETGQLSCDALEPEDDVERWIADFLALEASGWKGRNGSALGSRPESRRFFVRAASEAARRGRLEMLALRLDGRPVAMRCAFGAGEGSFAFKIAYDETLARYSPGLLLEIEHLKRFHDHPAAAWMDSCAKPDHFMAERLWRDRRTLVTRLGATGRASGNSVIALLGFLRRCVLLARGRS